MYPHFINHTHNEIVCVYDEVYIDIIAGLSFAMSLRTNWTWDDIIQFEPENGTIVTYYKDLGYLYFNDR